MERVILVCDGVGDDECGEPATSTIILRSGGENMAKDVCDEHYDVIYANAHKPKRGRQRRKAA